MAAHKGQEIEPKDGSKYKAYSNVFIDTAEHGTLGVRVLVKDSVVDDNLALPENNGEAAILAEIYPKEDLKKGEK